MKVYMIIAQKDFRDEEILVPKEILEAAGFQVIIASPDGGVCKGMLGASVTADIKISEIDVIAETKALILIGGVNSPSLMDVEILGKKLELAKEKKIIIGAICLAPMIVASFDILHGMSATVFPTEESLKTLKDHKVLYIPEDVVVEDWLVTANGPQSAQAFGEALVELLQ